MEELKADLVLEGGGVKGIALVGAISVLQAHGYQVPRVAGSSAGAIVGALVAAGMPAERMVEVVGSLDYRRFRDPGRLDRIPLAIGPALSILFEQGVYEGDYLREWLGNEFAALGVETFADLAVDDPGASLTPEQRFELVVTATDVTRGELIRLPWDYLRYGLAPADQLVVDAVRASMSIPFFYEPVKLRDRTTGLESTLVDGGVLSNFPIDTFDRTDGQPPRWPTFGIKLFAGLPAASSNVFPLPALPRLPPVRLLESLVATMIVGRDQARLALPWVDARTIRVDTEAVNFIDFGLGVTQRDLLFENGRSAAGAFLSSWDWQAYLDRFRRT